MWTYSRSLKRLQSAHMVIRNCTYLYLSIKGRRNSIRYIFLEKDLIFMVFLAVEVSGSDVTKAMQNSLFDVTSGKVMKMFFSKKTFCISFLRPVQTKPTSCNIVGPTVLHNVGQKF